MTGLCLSFELKAHMFSCQFVSLLSSVLCFSRLPWIPLMTSPITDSSGVRFDLWLSLIFSHLVPYLVYNQAPFSTPAISIPPTWCFSSYLTPATLALSSSGIQKPPNNSNVSSRYPRELLFSRLFTVCSPNSHQCDLCKPVSLGQCTETLQCLPLYEGWSPMSLWTFSFPLWHLNFPPIFTVKLSPVKVFESMNPKCHKAWIIPNLSPEILK